MQIRQLNVHGKGRLPILIGIYIHQRVNDNMQAGNLGVLVWRGHCTPRVVAANILRIGTYEML